MFSDKVVDYEDAEYIIVLGLATDKKFKRKGYASKLMKYLISTTDKSILLTCHDYLVDFYRNLGFIQIGISDSKFAGSQWYDMTYIK